MSAESALLDEWAAAWSSHDVHRVAALFTDDCVYEDVTLGIVNRGKEELRAFGSGFLAAVPNLRVEIGCRFTCGALAGIEWTMSGTQTGEFPGLPASGRTFSLRGASICEVRESKLVRCSDYWDMNTFLKQLGFAA